MPPHHNLIFIHGVADAGAEKEYASLYTRMAEAWRRGGGNARDSFSSRFKPVRIVWEQLTGKADEKLFRLGFPNHEFRRFSKMDFSVIANVVPAMKYLMAFYVGDMIAYLSDESRAIRNEVWRQMLPHVIPTDAPYTIIAHSMGSVIAYDILSAIAKGELGGAHRSNALENLRSLFFLGSPLGMFFFRDKTIWSEEGNFSRLTVPPEITSRQWTCLYNPKDPFAFQLEGILRENPANDLSRFKETAVPLQNIFGNPHADYWHNDRVAERIVEGLGGKSEIENRK